MRQMGHAVGVLTTDAALVLLPVGGVGFWVDKLAGGRAERIIGRHPVVIARWQ